MIAELDTITEETYEELVWFSDPPTAEVELWPEETPPKQEEKKPSFFDKLTPYLLLPFDALEDLFVQREAKKRMHKGLIALDLCEYKEARRLLEIAYSLSSKVCQNKNFFLARGFAREKTNDKKAALRDYTRAVRIKQSGCTYGSRAAVKLELGLFHGAVRDFSEALEHVPEHVTYYELRAQSLIKVRRYKEAFDDYTTAIGISPHISSFRYQRGALALRMYKYDVAITDYSKILSVHPHHVSSRINRGNAYLRKGDPKSALCDYTLVLSKTEDSDARFNRGLAFFLLGDCDAALRDLSQIDDPEAAYWRAHAYEKRDKPNFEIARGDYQAAAREYGEVLNNKRYGYQAKQRKKLTEQIDVFLEQVFF